MKSYKSFLSILILLSAQLWGQTPKSYQETDIQTLIQEEYDRLDIALKDNNVSYVRSWTGDAMNRNMKVLSNRDISSRERFLAWKRVVYQAQHPGGTAAFRAFSQVSDQMGIGLTLHGISTNIVLTTAIHTLEHSDMALIALKSVNVGFTALGGFFSVAGFYLSLDAACTAWAYDQDVTLATLKLTAASVGLVITVVSVFISPAVAMVLGVISSIATMTLDWVCTIYNSYLKHYYENNKNRVMKAYRTYCDQTQWVPLFKGGGFKGVLQKLKQNWLDTSWRSEVQKDIDSFTAGLPSKHLDEICMNDYFRNDVVPSIQGWLKSEISYTKEKTAEYYIKYFEGLRHQTVRIHIDPVFRNYLGRRLKVRPLITVQGQKLPFTPPKGVQAQSNVRPVQLNEPYINLELHSGGFPFYVTNLTMRRAGQEIQVQMPLIYFLQIISENHDEFDIDAVLHRPGMPDMDLPVRPLPLRVEDLVTWNHRGFEISRENKEIHISLRGGVDIILPEVPVEVQVKGAGGQNAQGYILDAHDKRVPIASDGKATVMVPSSGYFYVSHLDASGRPTGQGVTIKGGLLNPLDHKANRVNLNLVDQSSAVALPLFPKVDTPIQDADAVMSRFQSCKVTFEEMQETFSRVKSHLGWDMKSARQQWASYLAAYKRKLSAQNLMVEAFQAKIRVQEDRFQKVIDAAEQDNQRLEDRYQRICRESSEKLTAEIDEMKRKKSEALRLYTELWSLLKECREAVKQGNRVPHSYDLLSDIEVERKKLQALKMNVQKASGKIKSGIVSLQRASDQLELSIELIADRFLSCGSNFRTGYFAVEYDKAIGFSMSLVDLLDVANAFLETHSPESTMGRLQKSDEDLGWLQLRSQKQLLRLVEYDQWVGKTPGFLRSLPKEIAAMRDLQNTVDKTREAMSLARHHGEARRPDEVPHNGFGMDAWEQYRDFPGPWETMRQDLDRMLDGSAGWEEGLNAARTEIAAIAKGMDPEGWYVAEVARAFNKRLKQQQESLSWRKALVLGRDRQKMNFEYLERMKRESELEGLIQWDDHLLANIRTYAAMKKVEEAVEQKNLAMAESLYQDAIAHFPAISEMINARYKKPRGSVTGFQRPPARELSMLHRLDDLWALMGIHIQHLKQKQNQADLAELTVFLTGKGAELVWIKAVDQNGREALLSSNAAKTSWSGPVPPGTYQISVGGKGVLVEPSSLSITLGKSEKKQVTIRVKPAIQAGNNTASIQSVALHSIHSSSWNVVNAPHIPDERPVFTPDNRFLITTGLNQELNLLKFDVQSGRVEKLLLSTPDLGSEWESARFLGGVYPVVVGETVIYKAGASFYHLGMGSYEKIMSVPVSAGDPTVLFDLREKQFQWLDARFTTEPEFLVEGTDGSKTGYYIIKGMPPDVNAAEFIAPLTEYGDYSAFVMELSVSRNWKVFSERIKSGPRWKIHNRRGDLLSKTPDGVSWQRLTLSPDGTMFAVVTNCQEDSSAMLAVGEVGQSNDLVPVYSGVINIGFPAWSSDGRYLAARVFRGDRGGDDREELRVFDLRGLKGEKYTGSTATPKGSTASLDKEDDQTPEPKEAESYTKAYNKLTKLMAEGKGDTPEAQEAYRKYKEAKDAYEKVLEKK